jgi:hypothetical protein
VNGRPPNLERIDMNPLELAATLHRNMPNVGGPITALADDKTTRVGAFLDAATQLGATKWTSFPATEYPILEDGSSVRAGEHGTVGTALDYWLQLAYTDELQLRAAATGIFMSPPAARLAGWDLPNDLGPVASTSNEAFTRPP